VLYTDKWKAIARAAVTEPKCLCKRRAVEESRDSFDGCCTYELITG
jgi:hypothetical protein